VFCLTAVAAAAVWRLRRSITAVPRFRRVVSALDDAAGGRAAGRQAAGQGRPR
jgi:hypothetical protein